MDKHLIIVFWNLGIGGIQTRVSALIMRTLQKYPHTKITLLLYERKANEVIIPDDPRVSIVSFPGVATINVFGFKKKFWRFTTFQLICWLYYHLIRKKPTHIVTFLNRFSFIIALYIFAKKISGKAPVFIINEPVIISEYLKRHEAGWWTVVITFSYKTANKIIVATDSVKQDLIQHFRVGARKITVIKSWTQINHE